MRARTGRMTILWYLKYIDLCILHTVFYLCVPHIPCLTLQGHSKVLGNEQLCCIHVVCRHTQNSTAQHGVAQSSTEQHTVAQGSTGDSSGYCSNTG